jgi:hypothetical protein
LKIDPPEAEWMSLQASPSATTRQVAPSFLRVKISLANFFFIESKEITFKDLKRLSQERSVIRRFFSATTGITHAYFETIFEMRVSMSVAVEIKSNRLIIYITHI